MNKEEKRNASWISRLFVFILAVSAISGFAQMPVFKRYYVADIPGFGWLADFFFTYRLHHFSAMAFLALGSYVVIDYLLVTKSYRKVTAMGFIRGFALSVIGITGILMVVRNFPGYRFSPEMIIWLNFSHLGLVVGFLMLSLAAVVAKKRWTSPRHATIQEKEES